MSRMTMLAILVGLVVGASQAADGAIDLTVSKVYEVKILEEDND